MWRVCSGANGEYVAWENEDGFHHAPASWSQEANQGWDSTEDLEREANRLNRQLARLNRQLARTAEAKASRKKLKS